MDKHEEFGNGLIKANVDKKNNTITITFPLLKPDEQYLSRTGRSKIVYTSRGWLSVDDEIAINLTAIKRVPVADLPYTPR